MQLTIDLDLNKIDYDSINKQIMDKISAMNVADMYQISNRIEI